MVKKQRFVVLIESQERSKPITNEVVAAAIGQALNFWRPIEVTATEEV